MPIDLYSSLRGASQWAFGSPLLNNILGSSLFVAIVVALLMILLIMFMYPAKPGTSFAVIAKMFVYMFFSSLLVIFLHDGVIKYMMEEESAALDADDFMQNTTMRGRLADPAYGGLYKTISPQNNVPPDTSQIPSTQQAPAAQQVASDVIQGGREHLSNRKPNHNAYKNPYS
jgi:hypothetical protein